MRKKENDTRISEQRGKREARGYHSLNIIKVDKNGKLVVEDDG